MECNNKHLEKCLQYFIVESKAAEVLGMSRQLLHQKNEEFKRNHGGIKSPSGWIYKLAGKVDNDSE
jgi:hypothetical protein